MPMTLNLGCIVRESAKSYPDKVAVIYDGGSLTYAELDGLSDGLAAGLRARGSRPASGCGLQLPNIPQFVIAYFGILKAGCVVVPMNVLLKAAEVAFQLGDCRRPALITWAGVGEEAAKALAEAGVQELYVVSTPGPPEVVDGGALRDRCSTSTRACPPPLVQTDPGDTAVIDLHLRHDRSAEGRRAHPLPAVDERRHPWPAVRHPRGRRRPRRAAAVPRLRAVERAEHLRPLRRPRCRSCRASTPAKVIEVIRRDRVTMFEGVPTMFIALLSQPEGDQATTSPRCASGSPAAPRCPRRCSTPSSASSAW